MATKETIEAYIAAWNERDAGKRRKLIDQCWAESGTYTDPMSDIAGRDALNATIEGFHAQMPDAGIALITSADEHHGRIRFGWKLEGGPQPLEGIDVGRISADGKIESIVGFWGANPPA